MTDALLVWNLVRDRIYGSRERHVVYDALLELNTAIEERDAEIKRLRKLLTDVRNWSDDPNICNYIDAHTLKGGDDE